MFIRLHSGQHILALLGEGQCLGTLRGVGPAGARTVVEKIVDHAGENDARLRLAANAFVEGANDG